MNIRRNALLPRRLLRFLRDARERKVLHTLAIYIAVAWGAMVGATEVFPQLGLPDGAFHLLVAVLVLALPAVLFVSWHFDVLLEQAGSRDERPVRGAPAHREPEEAGSPEPGQGLRRRRLAVPTALVVVAALGAPFLFRALAGDPPPPPPLLVVSVPAAPAADAPPPTPGAEWVRRPLELLLGPEVAVPSDPLIQPASRAATVAVERGAPYALEVELFTMESRPVLRVGLIEASTGRRLLEATGGGGAETLAEAGSRLALEVARVLDGEEVISLRLPGPVAAATGSATALAHYLEGSRRFVAGDFEGAADAFDRAVQSDSSFAPAYYRLAIAERWRWDYDHGLVHIEAGLARATLSPRWRALFEAQRAYLMKEVDASIAAFQQVTLHYPELPDGWLGLGEALFHYGGFGGHRLQDARAPLERALRGDSLLPPIHHHLVELAIYRRDPVAAAQLIEATPQGHPVRRILEAAYTINFGSQRARADLEETLRRWTLRDLSLLFAHLAFDPVRREQARAVAEVLLDEDRPPADRRRGAEYLIAVAPPGGREAALETWRRVAGREAFDPWVVAAHQAGWEIPEARAMMASLRARVHAGEMPRFDIPTNDAGRRAFRGLVHEVFLHGDSLEVASLITAIAAAAPDAPPTDPDPRVLTAALEARRALLAADTAAAIDALLRATARTQEPYVTFYPLGTMAPERLTLIRIALATGGHGLARRWIVSFGNAQSVGDLLYRSTIDDLRAAAREEPIP